MDKIKRNIKKGIILTLFIKNIKNLYKNTKNN